MKQTMANRVAISADFHIGCEELCSRDYYDGTLWFLIATYWEDGHKWYISYNQKHLREVKQGTQAPFNKDNVARQQI